MQQFYGIETPGLSVIIGILALLVLYLFFVLVSFISFPDKTLGVFNPSRVIVGKDGRASTSKFQFFLWTVVIIFTSVAFCSLILLKGWKLEFPNMPVGLFLAMGFSIGTATAAKGITVSYMKTNQLNKSTVDSVKDNAIYWDYVFKDDDGSPDLIKMQMLAWTFIAAGIYLAVVLNIIYKPNLAAEDVKEFPDIATALIVLMGLGHGAYVGNKLIISKPPIINALNPDSGNADTEVEIQGSYFGSGGQITFNDKPLGGESITIKEWTDTSVKFIFPKKQATDNTADWIVGDKINIGIIVNGQKSSETREFTITQGTS